MRMRGSSRLPTVQVPLAETLDRARRVVVRQARDWTELIALEARNRYALLTEEGALAGMALEQPGNFLLRWLLKSNRPFEMAVYDAADQRVPQLRLRRPWRWWMARLEVLDADGRPLGAIQQRWSWLRRRFDVEGPDGRVLARIAGPFWRPWTFLLEDGAAGRELGRIEKKWSGMVSEAFTDADTFLVTLPAGDARLRRLLLAAAILVDFKFFEKDG
jgi:uncharacterized protein YxjI